MKLNHWTIINSKYIAFKENLEYFYKNRGYGTSKFSIPCPKCKQNMSISFDLGSLGNEWPCINIECDARMKMV